MIVEDKLKINPLEKFGGGVIVQQNSDPKNDPKNNSNKPNNNMDATELKQPEPQHSPVLYDRKTGLVTAASDFVGLPDEIMPAWGSESVANYGRVDRLDDGYNGAMGLNYNMCSKSCCGPQYSPPFKLEEDAMVDKMKDKFVPNNYSCNNAWNNTGCVCMTKNNMITYNHVAVIQNKFNA